MKKYIKRLTFAFLFSASCYGSTYFWYQSVSNDRSRTNNEKAIAKLSDSTNEVQRKQIARVIWEEISLNDELYPGEAIRTSSGSQAKILFLENGTEIELEPDSLIVLEKNQDGIALDFLKGNLFVSKSKSGSTGSSVKLKTGKNEINLNNAELSLSKSETGKVDLEVFKGTAELSQNGKSTVIDQSKAGTLDDQGLKVDQNRIQVTSPLPGSPVYIDPAKKEPVTFSWKSIDPSYTVYVERGKKRSVLYRNENFKSKGDTSKLKLSSKVGRYFFRLVAIPKDPNLPELKSRTFPIEVKAKIPPVVLSPEKNANLVLKGENKSINLRWVARNKFEQLTVEIAKDPSLQQKVLTEPLEIKNSTAEIPFAESGQFYLRLTGYMDIDDKLVPLSSPVIPFVTQLGVDLRPPKLKSPALNQRLTFQQITENGLFISWEPVGGIKKYHLRIINDAKVKVVDKTVLTNPLRMNDITPGNYQWSMRSITDEGKKSKFAEKQTFFVEEMPLIKWVGGPDPERYFYWTKKPSLTAQWQKNVQGVTSWRLRVVPEGKLDKDSPWIPASAPMFRATMPQEGVYALEVEGLNAEGNAIARSGKKLYKVQEMELLPPPRFTTELPKTLKASRSGDFSLGWKQVKGATKYKFQLLSEDGEQILEEKIINRTTASLNRMRPGKYQITVKAVDQYERDGEPTKVRTLEVPRKSGIKAPTLNKINVK